MDIHEVYDAVHTLCARWSDLCFALKLPPAEEEAIGETHSGTPRKCLREVVKKWLRKNYNFQKDGHPSWRFLVRAVGDPNGGNDCALAETIGKDHTGRLKCVPLAMWLLMTHIVSCCCCLLLFFCFHWLQYRDDEHLNDVCTCYCPIDGSIVWACKVTKVDVCM